MYNGIGLQTPRGSGTNGYVTRNLSAIRKTKEKVPEYKGKEDAAVRPYDAELIEHERRRQAEVRCMELRELLEEEGVPDEDIEEKVNAFRAKLLAEKKLSLAKDASGRTMVKDSHELSMAQESKNERAKDAFGIRNDFVPGSSFEGKQKEEKPAAPSTSIRDTVAEPTSDAKSSSKHESKSRKRKKSKKSSKRSSSSSSSSSTSSDEEAKRKKRKKDRKKKSKKSHHHRRDDDEPPHNRSSSSSSGSEESHNSSSHNAESDGGNGEIVAKYSVAILDIASHGEVCANTIDLPQRSHSQSPVDIIESTLIPVLQTNSDCTSTHNTPNSRKFSHSPCSVTSRSRSGSPVNDKRRSRKSRSPSVRSAHSSHTHSSRSSVDRSKSPSDSSRSPSRSKSRSRSRSNSSSGSSTSASSSRSTRSIPRRRGPPSFLDRRRITSARKRPIPYKRRNGCEWDVSSSSSDSS